MTPAQQAAAEQAAKFADDIITLLLVGFSEDKQKGISPESSISTAQHAIICSMRKALAEARRAGVPACKWTLIDSYDDEHWETSCGEAYCFFADGPKENNCRYCTYCGGVIEIEQQAAQEGP